MRSGSLITARMAGELGRVVFAVPGSPLDPRAGGTNDLIKNGALLVTEASDIIEALAPQLHQLGDQLPLNNHSQLTFNIDETTRNYDTITATSTDNPKNIITDTDREKILNFLSPVPISIDELIRHSGIEAAEVFLILLELDLAGQLSRYPNGNVALVPMV